MRTTKEAIKDKVRQRAWDQASIEARQIKLQRYRSGESLGTDIPAGIKLRDKHTCVRRKIYICLLLIGFVVITA